MCPRQREVFFVFHIETVYADSYSPVNIFFYPIAKLQTIRHNRFVEETQANKTVVISEDVHHQVDVYAAINKLSIKEVVETAIKLFLPVPSKERRK